MTSIEFDIETNGLLDVLTKIHCICTYDKVKDIKESFRPNEIMDAILYLEDADELIAHNGFWFDYPAIKKLYPKWKPRGRLRDSLAESRLIYSNLKDMDWERSRKKPYALPAKLYGSHSIKAWGYRLGVLKGDFGEATDWQHFSEEMLSYCEQDVEVTRQLVALLESKNYSPMALDHENRISALMALQERNGFAFNKKAAVSLYQELAQKRASIKEDLIISFGWWNKKKEVKHPKKTLNYKDPQRASVVEGAPYTTFERITFNPASRAHIVQRLQKLYGWEPKEFTDKGQAKIDEKILGRLNNPHAKALCEYLMINKRIGQLAEGDNAWLRMERNGFIHGHVNPNGAITGRATHAYPNIAQVPSTKAPYGKECRSLFTVPEGWTLLGSDADQLELRVMGHYMARYDKGKYVEAIKAGDIHWTNTLALELLPKGTVRDIHNPKHEHARNIIAKRFVYLLIYGGGDELAGSVIKPDAPPELHKKLGRKYKNKLLKNLPALKYLLDAVKKTAKDRGYLVGLDGRHVAVSSQHKALNYLLQGAGALICKRWLLEIEDLCQANGLTHGWHGDYAFCAWVHDEVQIACRTEEIAKQIGSYCEQAMDRVTEIFSFRCPLKASYDIGLTWADTH
ncbi:DNA polymerase [Spartinivicinus ruber]|uniref:DNA polymerase n=1 Tax=Spartinivicinus ruber TaxID=2683272 RepID=UPI0013D34F38|nr:DNA polymerase [Spartinivicinus ruber]